VRQLCTRVWEKFWEDEVLDRAAALSYYLLFALFPTLLFLTALLSLMPLPNLMESLMGYVARVLPGDAASLIQRTLAEVTQDRRHGLLSLGAAVALWSASAGMVSVMTALNIAYGVTEARPWWRRRLVAMGLTVGFVVFLVVSVTLMVFGPKLGEALAVWFGQGDKFAAAWSIISVPIAIGLVLTGIALVYYLAPAVRQQWRWITPGSVLAVTLWLIASIGLRLYVTFNSYSATYGSIGGVILLLLLRDGHRSAGGGPRQRGDRERCGRAGEPGCQAHGGVGGLSRPLLSPQSISVRAFFARAAPIAVFTSFSSSGGGITAGISSDSSHSSRAQPALWRDAIPWTDLVGLQAPGIALEVFGGPMSPSSGGPSSPRPRLGGHRLGRLRGPARERIFAPRQHSQCAGPPAARGAGAPRPEPQRRRDDPRVLDRFV
jgi:membrane protein